MIRSDPHKEMNEYMEKYLSIQSFSFSAPRIWKEKIEDRVKLLELNALKCCLKMTTADLR